MERLGENSSLGFLDLNEHGLSGNGLVSDGIVEIRLVCWKFLKSLAMSTDDLDLSPLSHPASSA